MAKILVTVDVHEGVAGDIGLQALIKTRAIAGSAEVVALALGPGAQAVAPTLPGYGASSVLVADGASLKDYLPGPYLAAVTAAVATGPFTLLVFPGTTIGNDLAPLLAARLDAACVLDASDLRTEGAGFVAVRTEYDRKAATRYAAIGDRPLVVSVKDGIATVGAPESGRTGSVQALTFTPPAPRARVARRDVAARSVNLKDAKIIVGAGAGIGSRDNFAHIQKLAQALGAQIGATRAVVDAGWLPADHQIGQTGATVRPELYIACGISGAVQHWVGVSDSRTIIAINTDKSAPIMKRAHYRITGDVNAVVPKLLKVLGA
jgi:electron transfer flavoprotein alpha subunit